MAADSTESTEDRTGDVTGDANEDTQEPEDSREDGKTVSEGPNSLSKAETSAGGADAVPDTPDKNYES